MRIVGLLIFLITLIACGGNKAVTNNKPSRQKPAPYVEPITGRIVQLQTEFGNMTIALSDSTPLHRDNFIKLVKQKFYDSLLFHRVINQFMIQGGDPDSKYAQPGQQLGSGGNGERIPAEFNTTLFHRKGALAAARDNNPQKASSPCQFYIVQGKIFNDNDLNNINMYRKKPMADTVRQIYKTIGGTPHLDENYTVFGQVTEGIEVIDKIATLLTTNDRPNKDVRMKMLIIR